MSNYVKLPKKLTTENGAKALLMGEFYETVSTYCEVCYGTGCVYCDSSGEVEQKIPVSWTTIKEIYSNIVENLGEEINE
jgi:hypothetical protein